jgi:hypothetical protein
MSIEDWAFGLVALTVIVCAVVCAVAWKVSYGDGWEAGSLHERNLLNTRRLRERREARRAEEDSFGQWLKQLGEDDGERLADTGELRIISGVPGQPGNRASTDTGSFRAALAEETDAYLARMSAQEAAYREGLAS